MAAGPPAHGWNVSRTGTTYYLLLPPTSPMHERRHIAYSGHVQGVGFRYTTKSIAERYEVVGYVRNLPDGRVELLVEGTSVELDRFMSDLAEQMSEHIRSVECDKRLYGTGPFGTVPFGTAHAGGEFADFHVRY